MIKIDEPKIPDLSDLQGIHYISMDRMEGLTGEFHLFNNPQMPKIHIQPRYHGSIAVTAFGETVYLKHDDCLSIDPDKKKLLCVRGPWRFEDPVEKLIAISRMSQRKLTLTDFCEIRLYPTQVARCYNSMLDGDDKSELWSGTRSSRICDKEVIVVIDTEPKRKITQIIANERLEDKIVEWLHAVLTEENCIRQPSTAFDTARLIESQLAEN
jgi:hypothetical protein